MYYDKIRQEWMGFGCYIPSNNTREIEILEREALIKTREDLRKESGFYLYTPNNQPERSKREDHESGCGALNSMET